MTTEGHRRVAASAYTALGFPADEDWTTPLPTAPRSRGRTGSWRTPDGRATTSPLGWGAGSGVRPRATPSQPSGRLSSRWTDRSRARTR
jgi:hypothetical protein